MTVALVFPGALGDLLLLAPAIAALARRDVRVSLSVSRSLGGLAAALFPGAQGPAADGSVLGSLFGSAVDPALARWLGAHDRVHAWLGADPGVARALRAAGARDVRLHRVVRADGAVHASVAYARALGLDRPAAVALPPALARPGDPARLVLHPGAGAPRKRWAAEGFEQVARAWRARGGEVVVLLGPAEEDEGAVWAARADRVVRGRDVLGAAAVVGSGGRYVGNDSGVSHLAGTLGRAGVVLFGPTRAARWRPFGGTLAPVCFHHRPIAATAAEIAARLGDPRAAPAPSSSLDTPTPEH